MKHRNTVHNVSKNTYGSAHFLERAVCAVCLIVMFLSPLAPLFASEIAGTETAPQSEQVHAQALQETSVAEPSVTETVRGHDLTTGTREETTRDVTPTTESSDAHEKTSAPVAPASESVSKQTKTPPTEGNGSATEGPRVQATTTASVAPPLTDVAHDIVAGDTATGTTPTNAEEVIAGLPSKQEPTLSTLTNVTPLLAEATTSPAKSDAPKGETTQLSAVTNDENRFVFGKSECVSAGDDTFYCTKSVARTTPSHADRVFSSIDTDGDKEIYIERNSIVTKITDNAEDDDAPYFDESSHSLVWHRLTEGRYQIISYDIETRVETQITHDRYNNMEPHRYGDITVWQGWVGNDWEIMMLKGDVLTMITDNTTQDITPSINGDHIVWQSFEGNSWKMKVYDTRTKEIRTIEDSEGGSVENPRFVLVYDTKLASGDVETRGFNLETGEVVSLGAKPVPVPEDIPDPDQTGEKRALVTTPTQPKTKVEGDDDSDATGSSTPPIDPDHVGDGDIVIPPLVRGEGATSTLDIRTTTPIDVTIPSFDVTSSSSVDHIEDIVIPSFIPRATTPSDSQSPIVPLD